MTTKHTNEIAHDMPFAEYQSRPGLNATTLKAARKSMLAAQHAMSGGGSASASMAWGSLVHAAILEPARIAVYDGIKRGAAWESFRSSHAGREIANPGDAAALGSIIARVRAIDSARLLLDRTAHEVCFFWRDPKTGASCKSRLDAYDPGVILEVKTARDISDRAFGNAFYTMGYHVQVGWQYLAAEACGDNSPAVYCLAVESGEPYDVRMFRVADSYVAEGIKEARELAARIEECRASGVWPGVSTTVDDLAAPAWTMADEVNMEGVSE